MKLLRVRILSAVTRGGLLDGFELDVRPTRTDDRAFAPICLIGPNGTGKSQFLQVLAEILQSLLHACVPHEERGECNPQLEFELEYLIVPPDAEEPVQVRASRGLLADRRGVVIERREEDEWRDCDLRSASTRDLLPAKVIAYTSGDNETLSLPFFVSRERYADEVGRRALGSGDDPASAPDPRLMLIDYGTHLEVLVANLMLGGDALRTDLLSDARLGDAHSFRCVVQLAHGAAPRAPRARRRAGRKGIQLTPELEEAIERLGRCATCSSYDDRSETYVFDYYVTDATRAAFADFWDGAFALYTALHKLAMLNDLAIPRAARSRVRRGALERRFASRLPEPQDEDKVFRFERVRFRKRGAPDGPPVDYVSLSDGEHQLAMLLGTMGMLAFPGVFFLLDEPESHFNPLWRIRCVSRMLRLPTAYGAREDPAPGGARDQECLLTTHAPFVPSDLPRERVLIFGKRDDRIVATRPDLETYGATFDTILDECFAVSPPISEKSRDEIARLRESGDAEEVQEALHRFGPSIEKAFLFDRLRQIERGEAG